MISSIVIRNTEPPLARLLFHDLEDLHVRGLVKDVRSIEMIRKEEIRENEWQVERIMEMHPFFILHLPSKMYAFREKAHLDMTNDTHHVYRFILTPVDSMLYEIEGRFDFWFQDDGMVRIEIRLDCEIKNRYLFFRETIQKKLTDSIMAIYLRLFKTIEDNFSLSLAQDD